MRINPVQKKIIPSIFILILFLGINSHAKISPPKQKILYLSSYNYFFTTSHISLKAIKQTFPLSSYIIDMDYMDSKNFAVDSLYDNIYERIRIKKEHRRGYDIILTSDDNALQFVLKNQDSLFKNIPIVFWGLNDEKLVKRLEKNKYITGISEKVWIKETIEFIKKAQPNVSEIIAFADNSTSAQKDLEILDSVKNYFPNLKISNYNISDHTYNQTYEQFRSYSSNQALLKLTTNRFKDISLNTEEIAGTIYRKASVPIYNLHLLEINMGLLGGCLFNYLDHAILACNMAKQILNGKDPDKIDIVTDYAGIYMADNSVLKKYKIKSSLLPKETVIVNNAKKEMHIRKDLFYSILMVFLITLIVLIIIIRLITQKRNLEKNLLISQQNYETLFRENQSISLIIESNSGAIYDANKAALKFYGYSLDEITALNFKDINAYPHIDVTERMDQAQKNLREGVVLSHKTKNGNIKDVEVFSGIINLQGKEYLHAIILDITDKLKAEREIIEARLKAEESDNLKSSFLANMSHEIRTPMNIIIGFSDLLVSEEIPKKKQIEYIKLINSNSMHLLTLINDIIDISKIEANQLKVTKKECNINELLDEIYSEFENHRISDNKKFSLKLEKGIDKNEFITITDCTRLKQIFINLLSNAFKFTDEGEVWFGYKFRDDSMIQFFVKDTGIGIPKDKHEHVFSVFQRVEDSFTKNYEGSGLGLSITKSLVEKLGGHIWLMSEVGKGSRFYFTIPGYDEKLNI